MEIIGEIIVRFFMEIIVKSVFGGVIAFFRWCFGQYMGEDKTFMDYFNEDITTRLAIIILQGLCVFMLIALICLIIGVMTSCN